MVRNLKAAETAGRLTNKLGTYLRPGVLVVDEVGYQPLERAEANLVFQVISKRYEKGSIILTSNKTFSEWGQVFGDEVLATAILDPTPPPLRSDLHQRPQPPAQEPPPGHRAGHRRGVIRHFALQAGLAWSAAVRMRVCSDASGRSHRPMPGLTHTAELPHVSWTETNRSACS
jgi:hypothetical protein